MADNSSVPVASGNETFANDDIGGVKYPRPKINWGPDGTANDVDVASGKPLPVQLRSSTGADFVKAEDAASAGGDFGVPALAIQLATPADTAGTDGDYAMLQMSSGRLWVDASGKTLTVAAHAVTNAGTFAVQAASAGDVAHSAADSGNPIKVGHKAIAHGANPTAVDAAERTDWYANRHGIPWVIGGHPNVITRSATIDDADGAQTNASLLTISAGNKIVVTSISATASASNSGAVAVRIGFGTATLGAASEGGTDGILLEGKFPAGGGHQRGNGAGILGVGADNEDLRITCDDPAGGSLFVTFSYYTVES